ncbi:MAG TPA: NAD(P) transhydrogenase subunit alpha [Trueperaceae bacterium]|nr:NAD(P) transhydrogenase subunit alpha [Trueperaceae bacterium]
MNISAIKESNKKETRIAITPASAKKLVGLGATVTVPKNYGAALGFSNEEYEKAGALIQKTQKAAIEEADILVSVNKATDSQYKSLKDGAIVVSLLDPFRELELVQTLSANNLSAFAMELVPRTTYAQKMDALSSQASLAGYTAVIKAADVIAKSLPMMSTPAGTIPPAKVFIIGVGVAGLQAIATAKRLGARVEAYDTRPVVEEQVKSLGAKFVKIDVGETGQTEQGYAKALTEEQIKMQQEQMAKVIAGSDIVITTAQLFGRPAPLLVTEEMVKGMKSGSILVDLAASTGGNVAGTKVDEDVIIDGVKIIGLSNFAGEVAKDASQMYANNIANLLEHAWDKEENKLVLDTEDEIVNSVLLTHAGEIRDERVKKAVEDKK